MRDDADLLTIHQAAIFLNVSETSLRRWTNSGLLPCARIGTKKIRRFYRADLIAFLQKQPEAKSSIFQSMDDGHAASGKSGYVAQGSHLCSCYTSNSARVTMPTDLLAEGLREGCTCFLISSSDLTKKILQSLTKKRPGVQQDIDKGRLRISEYLQSGQQQIKKLEGDFRQVMAQGAKSMRLVGMVSDSALASNNSFSHILQHEKAYDDAFGRLPLTTFCHYDARQHTGAELVEILKCHHEMFSHPVTKLLV